MADNLENEWKHICVALKALGISREEKSDKMVWAGKMKEGNISIADVYDTWCGGNDINLVDPVL